MDRVISSAGWLFIIAVPAAVAWLAFTYSYQDYLPEAQITLDMASVVVADEETTVPPALYDSDAVTEIKLPHDWSLQPMATADEIWYITSIALNVPPNRLWGLYLPAVSMNVAVYLNDELLGQGGDFNQPIARVWNYPLYFVIPNGMMAPGENLIQLRVKGDPASMAYLSRLHLGPDSELRPAFEQHHQIKVAAVIVIAAALLFTAVAIGSLWLQRRQDTMYGWFAASCLAWGLHDLNFIVINIPMQTRLWDYFAFISLGWFMICLIVFIHRYLELQRQKSERYLLISGLIFSAMLLLAPISWFYWLGYKFCYGFIPLLGLYPCYLLLQAFARRRSMVALLMAVCSLTIVVLASHDWLAIMGLLGDRTEGHLIQYGAPAPLLVVAWILLTHFVQARNEAEALNRDLERRVEQKSQELAANYDKLRQLEREQVLADERDRIMRDMHDGMGGHLISTLSMVESGQAEQQVLADALRAALDDLRLMIDSMDPIEDDLTMVLGMFRSRLETRLHGSGLTVDWQVQDVPPLQDFGPQKVLQLLRILQEAVTNVIKHAGASILTLRTGSVGDKVFLEVADNGKGLASDASSGRGLGNMRRRAETINADLEFNSQSGTQIRLWLPMLQATGKSLS